MLLSTAQDLANFTKELQNETDRGLPLVSAAFIDSKLEEILTAFFCDKKSIEKLLLVGNAPLGTFSAKIELCLALGLIDDFEYKEIHLIRKIRNIFAHEKHGISFDSAEIRGLCSSFETPILDDPDFVVDSSRKLFINAAMALILQLYHRPDYVAKETRIKKSWIKACLHPSQLDGTLPIGTPYIAVGSTKND